jgi:hypothetical protein
LLKIGLTSLPAVKFAWSGDCLQGFFDMFIEVFLIVFRSEREEKFSGKDF